MRDWLRGGTVAVGCPFTEPGFNLVFSPSLSLAPGVLTYGSRIAATSTPVS